MSKETKYKNEGGTATLEEPPEVTPLVQTTTVPYPGLPFPVAYPHHFDLSVPLSGLLHSGNGPHPGPQPNRPVGGIHTPANDATDHIEPLSWAPLASGLPDAIKYGEYFVPDEAVYYGDSTPAALAADGQRLGGIGGPGGVGGVGGVGGIGRLGKPSRPGEPNQDLPEAPNRPDQGLPEAPNRPGNALPTPPNKPDQGLPGASGRPDQGLPAIPEPKKK